MPSPVTVALRKKRANLVDEFISSSPQANQTVWVDRVNWRDLREHSGPGPTRGAGGPSSAAIRQKRPADIEVDSDAQGGGGIVANKEFNVLALIKGDERYVYVYDDVSRQSLVEAFHAQAADANLSLNWFDAAVLTQKAEEQAAGSPSGQVEDAGKTARPPRF
jgi:hypothetical protein